MAFSSHILLLFTTYLSSIHNGVDGFSACDEVDITFIIDSTSIIAYGESITKFIESIARHGSSEHSAFSVFVYGDIPYTQPSEILTLRETKPITTRGRTELMIEYRLKEAFRTIKNGESRSRTRYINVVRSFDAAIRQHRPYHRGDKKKRLGYAHTDQTLGNHDGRHIYIIFDYHNKLLQAPYYNMCNLFDRIDRSTYHRDEKIHFMLGHKHDKRVTKRILCHRYRSKHIKYNTFQHYLPKLTQSRPGMERIYDITCPAIIRSTIYDGFINVGNHVQYINIHNIMSCHLFFLDKDDNIETPDVIDTTKSFIKIKDYNNDDNTYQLYDYLVADATTYKAIQKIGCRYPVYKIIKIGHGVINNGMNEIEAIRYRILTLYVVVPSTPMDYISTANIKGHVPINTQMHQTKRHRRRKRWKSPFTQRRRRESNEWMGFDKKGRRHAPPPPSGAKVLHGDMLLQRITRLKNIAHRAVIAKKHAITLTRTYSDRDSVFDAKLMQQVFLGKIGSMFKKVGSKIKKKVHGVVKKVGRAINKVRKRIKKLVKGRKKKKHIKRAVIEIESHKNWTFVYTETPKVVRTLGSKRDYGYKALGEGDGAMMLKYGFKYRLDVGVYFRFYWKIVFNKVLIEYKLYGDWNINIFFNAKFVGPLNITLDNILNYGETKVFYIGSIPILLRPYTQIYAQIFTLEPEINTGIRCEYRERIEIGYVYNNQIKKKKNNENEIPTITRRLIRKGCTKELGIVDKRQKFVHECPIDEFRGFDLRFSVKIGCSFYRIMNAYLRMGFVVPFRVNMPEMNPTACGLPPKSDMCMVSGSLKASFTMRMDLNVYTAVSVDANKISRFVHKAMFDAFTPQNMSKTPEKLFDGPIKIIPQRFMGCLNLDGKLKSLNDQLFAPCCPHVYGLYHGHMPPVRGQYVIGANPVQNMFGMNAPFIPNPFYKPPPPQPVQLQYQQLQRSQQPQQKLAQPQQQLQQPPQQPISVMPNQP